MRVKVGSCGCVTCANGCTVDGIAAIYPTLQSIAIGFLLGPRSTSQEHQIKKAHKLSNLCAVRHGCNETVLVAQLSGPKYPTNERFRTTPHRPELRPIAVVQTLSVPTGTS